jgi:D-alanine-D-alanine ligase
VEFFTQGAIMSLKVGVLMGGWSPEKKISLMSGKNVVEGLKRAGLKAVPVELTAADKNEKKFEKRLKKCRFDVVFIALHGGFGEDGTLQALLDQWGIPYTGSGALACGLAMHKGCSKLVFEAQGIPSAPWHALHKTTEPKNWLKEVKLALPLVVKPADVGSAIGVTIVKKKTELAKAVRLAFKHSDWAIIEKFIPGVEVTVTVLGETALPVIEIVPQNEFYDFDAKYTPGHSDHIVPARISPAQTKSVKALALKAGKAMGCADYYRVDFIVPKKGEPQILEINTAPGMTLTSLVPDAAKAAGISFPALLKTLVGMALKNKKGNKA